MRFLVVRLGGSSGQSQLLTVDSPIVPYGDTTATFTVRIPAVQGSAVNFTYATRNSGVGGDYAVAGMDYTAVSGSGSIAAGDLTTTIAVTIAGNAPPNHRHEFELVVTDANNNTAVGTCLIANAWYIINFDKGTIGQTRKRDDLSGAWSTANVILIGSPFAAVVSDQAPPFGVKCLYHNMETSTGAQGTYGLDTGGVGAGDIFDALDYYLYALVKIESAFIWTGSNQNKMKCGRNPRNVGVNPTFGTLYIQSAQLHWQQNYPAGGNQLTGMACAPTDFGDISDGQWHEIVLHMKRESAYNAVDGQAHIAIDGQLVHSSTGISWTDPGETHPPGTPGTGVYFSNQGFFTWFENQIGVNGETTGGDIWTQQHLCMPVWPSPRYPKPW